MEDVIAVEDLENVENFEKASRPPLLFFLNAPLI